MINESVKRENVSKVFLLPGIQIKDELRHRFNANGFIDTYLTCEPFKYPYKVLYLLFRPERLDMAFNIFVTGLQENPNFVEVIDLINGKILLVYRIPEKFSKDYDLFLQGKYSKLSDAYKKCFSMEKLKLNPKTGRPVVENGKYIREHTNFYHIFNKTEERRLQLWMDLELEEETAMSLDELYERQNPERETLDLEGNLIW